jgi:hypothetical protein
MHAASSQSQAPTAFSSRNETVEQSKHRFLGQPPSPGGQAVFMHDRSQHHSIRQERRVKLALG